MEYPDPSKVHIYLCDDNDRPEMAKLAQKMGVGYLGLSGNKLAKAGNLNNALSKTDSPLVVTFDSDMIPRSSFLMKTVPYFFLPEMILEDGVWRKRTEEELDPDYKIGFVQTPQSFYNPDLFQFNFFAESNMLLTGAVPDSEFDLYMGRAALHLKKTQTSIGGKDNLFEIENWENISDSLELHEALLELIQGKQMEEKELVNV